MSNKKTIETVPFEVIEGEERSVQSQDGNIYAGDWMENMFKTGAADEITIGHFNDPIRGSEEPAQLEKSNLFRHVAIFGKKDYGAEKFHRMLLAQLIEQEDGVLYSSTNRRDIVELARHIPRKRIEDTVWINPVSDDFNGFNLFNTYTSPGDEVHESEVEGISTVFTRMLSVEEFDGNEFKNIIQESVEVLVNENNTSDETHTPEVLYEYLASDEKREAFCEKYADSLSEETKYTIRNMNDVSIDPLLRKFNSFLSSEISHKMFAAKEGDSLGKLILENKIGLIYLGDITNETDIKKCNMSIISGLMGSAMSQKSLSKTERAPFFCSLCNIDETVLNDDFLSYVFSKARGLNFGMILTSKTLDNIPELVQNGMYGNVSNQLTFRPNSGLSEASRLAQIYNVGGNEILELESNTYFGRLYKKDNSRTDALRISSLWPPVPYWTFKDVEDLIISDSENEN